MRTKLPNVEALCLVAFSTLFFSATLFAGQVLRVKGSGFIAKTLDGSWDPVEIVCVFRGDQVIGWGNIIAVRGSAAFIRIKKLIASNKPITPGDETMQTPNQDCVEHGSSVNSQPEGDDNSPPVSSPPEKGRSNWRSSPSTNSNSKRKAFGIHGGVNLATLANLSNSLVNAAGGSNITINSSAERSGLFLGAFHSFLLNSFLSLDVELNFVQRGAVIDATVSGTPATETIKTDYLETALLLKGQLNWGTVHPFLLIGPSLASALSRTISATANGNTVSGDASNGIRSIDLGLYGGGGLAFTLGESFTLDFEARYYYGLIDLDPAGSGVHHRGIAILAGFGWR